MRTCVHSTQKLTPNCCCLLALFRVQVVYDRAAIFWRYAKGWLIVDFLAAFPFTFIPGLGPEDAGGNHEAAYLLSLPKMFRVYSLMAMVQENHRLHEGCFMAVRTLLSVIVVSSQKSPFPFFFWRCSFARVRKRSYSSVLERERERSGGSVCFSEC